MGPFSVAVEIIAVVQKNGFHEYILHDSLRFLIPFPNVGNTVGIFEEPHFSEISFEGTVGIRRNKTFTSV